MLKRKFLYVFMIFSIKLAYVVSVVLYFIAPLIRKNNKKYKLAIFPYTQHGSDGYTRRIGEYLPFFEKDNISYKVFGFLNNDKILKALKKPHSAYLLYAYIPWVRLFQILKARNAEACFVQRSLFPYYPDQNFPYLEKLLFNINKNVVIDVWDAVWVYQPNFAPKVPKYCAKMTVVNSFLKDYYSKKYTQKNIEIFPIGVNLSKYKVKKNYTISDGIVKIFYTGAPNNVKEFIKIVGKELRKISERHKIKLVIVSRAIIPIEGINVEFHSFNEKTFFNIIESCDIGAYAFNADEQGMGKMAMKVLDYMAAGLPTVASNVGLSPYVKNNENILLSENPECWGDQLEKLMCSILLREKIGVNARKTLEKFHSLEHSYQSLKKILFN